jgi:hypothetical protein
MTRRRLHHAAALTAAAVTGAWIIAAGFASPATAVLAPTGGPARPAAARVWQPRADTDWMWELSVPLVLRNARLMGTGVRAFNGDKPPGDNPRIYDIDAIDNPASTIRALHRRGDHAICYIEVGAAGNYYSAAQEGIKTTYYRQLSTAHDLGGKVPGYPERFVNINTRSALAIIKSMIRRQCADKGFDGVETDLDTTFGNNEGRTGFRITQSSEQRYLTALARDMHRLGLAWIAKNLDDTGRASFVDRMEPLAQGIITEQCNQYRTCSLLRPFERARKWIGNAEYAPETQAEFCARDNAANFNGILFNVNLSGGRKPCR